MHTTALVASAVTVTIQPTAWLAFAAVLTVAFLATVLVIVAAIHGKATLKYKRLALIITKPRTRRPRKQSSPTPALAQHPAVEHDGSSPRAPARRSFSNTGATLGWAIVLLIVFAVFYVTASTHSAARANAASVRQLTPTAVIEADFAAINKHDWPMVWQLWYHTTPGYGPGYIRMISGYRLTARDVVTSLKASADAVSARVLAYETTGAVQTYDFSYKVHAGKITWGRAVLLGISHPSAKGAFPASRSS